jgi:uroporphyrin-III C-methyltransferase / precorrin-2 dehydrogenase / sirohydrochlorin ferrochelatase
MRFLPIFLDLGGRDVVIVGSGDAARNKFRLLQAAGARVRWLAAPDQSADADGDVRTEARAPVEADFDGAAVVISAAGDPLDRDVSAWARARKIPVNVVDRPELSTFIMPAIVDRGDVVVAIGTGGTSPVLARRIREKIEALLPARIGELAALLGRWRPRVSAKLQTFDEKRRFWENAVDGPVASAALSGRTNEAEELLFDALLRPESARENEGSVAIVGAGPGDPDLLTLKALRAISDADVIFYDDLVTEGVLDRVRRDAERVFVGKRRGRPGIGQDEINRHVLEAARAGKRVVRLKGGDPFVFGRGGEELEFLRAEGVRVTIVPGISAALGCAAEADLPLTLRNVATKLTMLTAHRVEQGEIDWSSLKAPDTTLVIYMGLAVAASIRDGLIGAGRDPATPVAILARGTWADAKSVAGRLDALPALAAQIGQGPALIVVGEVVRHSAPWRAAARLEEEVA